MNTISYLFKKNPIEVIILKSTIFVFVWTIIFIVLSLFCHFKIDILSSSYTNKVNAIKVEIKQDNWDLASNKLDNLLKSFQHEKSTWYKLINHGYFNEIFLSLEILDESIDLEDKLLTLQELERIKMILYNLEEDERCDFNRIF